MKVRAKQGLIILTAESAAELEVIAHWTSDAGDHVFALCPQDRQTVRLADLGPRPDACREPINVPSRSTDPMIQLISNLAESPFELDGRRYGSVEAFWQGLKFPDASRRAEIAPLHGRAARHAGFGAPESTTFEYGGQTLRVGTADHWRLMSLACRAKFAQHEPARHALLSTGERPLTHRTRRESRNIPGVIMADIWMKVRRYLAHGTPCEAATAEGDEPSATEEDGPAWCGERD